MNPAISRALVGVFFSLAVGAPTATDLVTAVTAAEEPKRPAVGEAVPEAVLRTVGGEAFSLRAAIKDKPCVLVFYRGGWCPYCSKHLFALAGIQDDLTELGILMLAISPDQPSKLREKPDYAKIPYQLLSDRTMAAARAFGIAFEVDGATRERYRGFGIDLEVASGETHHLLPHPAVYVIDATGIIRFAHVNEDYRERLEPEKILAAGRKVSNGPAKP